MPSGLTVHVGLSGAGKTYAMRQEVWALIAEGRTVIVIDRMREWEGVPPALAQYTKGALSEDEVRKALSAGQYRLIVWRPDAGQGDKATEIACELACRTKGPIGLAVAEAHNAWPKSFGSDPGQRWRSTVITEWRHHDVAVIADSQRFARLNTDLVELARTLRLFAMNGRNDLARCVEIGGKGLADAVSQCAEKLDAGEAGWHVLLGTARRSTYEITRYGQRSKRQAHAGGEGGEAARSVQSNSSELDSQGNDRGKTD